MNISATHHIGVPTQNMDEMVRFYTETLGCPITRRWDDVNIVFVGIGSTTVELIGRETALPKDAPAGRIDHIALHVPSTDAAFQELTSKGVTFRDEPRDFKTVRIAFFFDPDGNVLELVEERE